MKSVLLNLSKLVQQQVLLTDNNFLCSFSRLTMTNFDFLRQLASPDEILVRFGAPEFLYYVIISAFAFQTTFWTFRYMGRSPDKAVCSGGDRAWKNDLVCLCHAIFTSMCAAFTVSRDHRAFFMEPSSTYTILSHNFLVVSYGYYVYEMIKVSDVFKQTSV